MKLVVSKTFVNQAQNISLEAETQEDAEVERRGNLT
jgi:hypothetical protein